MFAVQNQWVHLKLIKIAFGKESKKADKSYEIVFLNFNLAIVFNGELNEHQVPGVGALFENTFVRKQAKMSKHKT